MIETSQAIKKTGILADVFHRPGRYLGDIRRCAPLSFSIGNTGYAGVTGALGGFALGALPAMGVQGCVCLLLAAQQARATYRGENYNVPMKWLARANWATAAALVAGAVAAGPLAVAAAALPATVLTVWGKGHWDLNKFITRMETLQKDGKAAALDENAIRRTIDEDPEVSRYLKKFQVEYGMGDIGAVVTAAAKGESLQQIGQSLAHGIVSWESLLPLAVFTLGLTKAFSKKGETFIDRITPGFLRRTFGTADGEMTPNRWYSAGYVVAGLAALGGAVATGGLTVKILGLVAAYTGWTHAYYTLDEEKPLPESADEYVARRQAEPAVQPL